MFSKVMSAILRSHWMIEPAWAHSHLPQVAKILQGEPFHLGPAHALGKTHSPQCIHPDAETGFVQPYNYGSFQDAPHGSVAMIPVQGPLLKYDGECQEPGTMTLSTWVQQANAAPNIAGILLYFDTPGGQVDGTQTLVDAVAASSKTTVAYVHDGMMCSAGYWIASACNYIFASQPTDVIGSIGVLTSFYDFRERLKSMGIALHEVYAPQSTDKNIEYRQALDGNYAPLEQELSFLADQFINAVKRYRSDKLQLSVSNPFTGKTYFAPEAMSVGLIDGICSIEQAVILAAGEVSYSL